jgi:hypothetical protein
MPPEKVFNKCLTSQMLIADTCGWSMQPLLSLTGLYLSGKNISILIIFQPAGSNNSTRASSKDHN